MLDILTEPRGRAGRWPSGNALATALHGQTPRNELARLVQLAGSVVGPEAGATGPLGQVGLDPDIVLALRDIGIFNPGNETFPRPFGLALGEASQSAVQPRDGGRVTQPFTLDPDSSLAEAHMRGPQLDPRLPSLRSFNPPARDLLANFVAENLLGGSNRETFRTAKTLVDVGETLVLPFGAALAAYDFGRSATSGDPVGMGLAALGLFPGKIATNFAAKKLVRSFIPPGPRAPGLEGHVFSGRVGRSDVKTEFFVHRPLKRAGKHASTAEDEAVAIMSFSVNEVGGAKPRVKDLSLKELSLNERMMTLGTVQNSLAEFVQSELPKGRALRVEFVAATDELERFYEKIAPRLETGYGVQVKRKMVKVGKTSFLRFFMKFPAGYKIPQPSP